MSQESPTTRRIHGQDADQRRQARREALLDAALDLFARHGFHQVSVDQICQTATVSTKSFYGIFRSREDCYLALHNHVTEQVMTQLAEVIEQTPAGVEPPVSALIEAFAAPYLHEPRYGTVLFGKGAAVTPTIDRLRRENRQWGAEFVVTIWRDTHPEVDVPAGVAIGVVGGLFEIIRQWSKGDLDPDTLRTELRSFYDATHQGLFGRRATRH
ncbi:TetR/AcrR family transcriptional regulator [Luteipulveratus halotolerans]|uniref:HTH tetR-type domain-containing protein n=1 Tax=Luteipulveratus halotolerans TaxID=1631356 RepID=A0A0L6CMB6_9MICO|nr:TetR/AcrR family transcriptional regulator [Luteipulveratus halotolerans]KNX38874.1 hypothetical protein VV01_19820 [Luteipulveratus halotolerans]